ncbi:MAG: hypothetical protein HGB12_13575, partial [Bacteroidetes bacterium]|nr:hypothetical protein [Bacteroidota bacterium]
MENNALKTILILLLVDGLLIASAFFPEIVINTSEKEFKIKFPAYNSVFDFSNKADNKKADSLINKY